MASIKEYLGFILEQLSELDEITYIARAAIYKNKEVTWKIAILTTRENNMVMISTAKKIGFEIDKYVE